MSTPVVYQYQRALDDFRREGREPALLKRMSELVSLLDFTSVLNSGLSSLEIEQAALLTVMGELRVSRGALYVQDGGARYRRRAARGLAGAAALEIEHEGAEEGPFVPAQDSPWAHAGLVLVCPVRKGRRTLGFLGLGPRMGGPAFAAEDLAFVESLAACAATPIENGLILEELRRVNESLSVKVFQLHNLFDIGRELTSRLDEVEIERLVTTAVMGYFLASRAALYRQAHSGRLERTHARGAGQGALPRELDLGAEGLRRDLAGPRRVADLAPGPLRDTLQEAQLALLVPLSSGGRASELLAVGARPAGRPYSDEDLDFVAALARHAQAALESARLHRMRLEKERQDRDLEIAREIQRSLFPPDLPAISGFELAAVSRSCFQVGGDYYDLIPLADGRLVVVIADVSGKGTPASIMMATVHASVQAMAGNSRPAELLIRLNRFLYERTQASRYVTLFYGELCPQRRRLAYVTAGHIPPYLLRDGGACERLRVGGPVIGLLEAIELETGEATLAPGDLLAVVTDGVTEAADPSGSEFGDEGVAAALRAGMLREPKDPLGSLVSAVDLWTGPAGCTDDMTILTLRAT